MKTSLQTILNLAGGGIAAISIVFVVMRLRQYSDQIHFEQIGVLTWLGFGGAAIIYGGANSLLTLAWQRLLSWFGENISYNKAMYIYGVSQLAKYVPGNIFHLAGRQAMGMGAGISAWPLAKSSFWELTLLIVSAIAYVGFTVPVLVPQLPNYSGCFITLSLLCLTLIFLYRIISRAALLAYCIYSLFLFISGGIFTYILMTVSPASEISIIQALVIIGAFVVAWLVGLITPGAPAGVGVRELILLSLLSGFINESELLLAVIVGRAITVLGDILYFIFSLCLRAARL